jgi:hypothetical protein
VRKPGDTKGPGAGPRPLVTGLRGAPRPQAPASQGPALGALPHRPPRSVRTRERGAHRRRGAHRALLGGLRDASGAGGLVPPRAGPGTRRRHRDRSGGVRAAAAARRPGAEGGGRAQHALVRAGPGVPRQARAAVHHAPAQPRLADPAGTGRGRRP